MPDVTILHAPLPAELPESRAASLLARLPYARQLHLEGRGRDARLASLLGLELMLAGVRRLRGRDADLARLSFPRDGKPRLDGGPCFSVSHAGSRVAAALSDRCDLGIDLESQPSGRLDRAALERWTAIEATLKCLGYGSRRAHEVTLDGQAGIAHFSGRVVYLRPVALAPECITHLATLEPVSEVEVSEWQAGSSG